MIAWKVGPALAAGCSVVLLPSPRGTLCTLAFVRLAEEAGVPPGVLNLVTGGAESAAVVTAHPDVDMVDLHRLQRRRRRGDDRGRADEQEGGARARRQVADRGAARRRPRPRRRRRRCCASAATPARAAAPRPGSWSTATTPTRSSRRPSRFLEEQVPTGDPHDEATEVGPLISAEHRERVEGYLARAVAGGARVLTGGTRPDGLTASTCCRRWSPTSRPTTSSARTSCSPPWPRCSSTTPSTRRWRSPTTAATGSTRWSGARPTRRSRSPDRLETGTVAINGGGGSGGPTCRGSAPSSRASASEMGEDGFAEFFTVKHLQWATAGSTSPASAATSAGWSTPGPSATPDRPFLVWAPFDEPARDVDPGGVRRATSTGVASGLYAARRAPGGPGRAGAAQLPGVPAGLDRRRHHGCGRGLPRPAADHRRARLRARPQRPRTLRGHHARAGAGRVATAAPGRPGSVDDLGRPAARASPAPYPRSPVWSDAGQHPVHVRHHRAAQGRRLDRRPTACGPARSARRTRGSAPPT